MAKLSKTLQLMALKLCLIEEDKVMSKAAEFERLLQTKSTTGNITDTAKVVICLDLAATILRVEFDQKTAIKCSGLKSPSYMNSRKKIENVLELNNDLLTISALCLTLQCNVQDLATSILDEYRKAAKIELDISLPQYVCMAVYQACRISKVKVPKSKLVEKSQLKSAQWTKLDAEWAKFTDKKFASVSKKKKGRLAKNAVIDEEKMEIDTEIAVDKKEEPAETQIEPYEDWKRRILEKAYKDLEQINKQNIQTQEKNTPNKQSSRNKHRDVVNKQNDTPIEQKQTPDKLNDNPSRQKDTSNKQKDAPSKQKDKVILLRDTPNRQQQKQQFPGERIIIIVNSLQKQNDTLNKLKDTPNKEKDTPNTQRETPGKQRDALFRPVDNSNSHFDMSVSPRKSPRKTPMKYEPYTSPVKTKGVRLLFPVER